MSEISFEQLFSDANLSLSTPENAFSLPSEIPGPGDWLSRLSDTIDRKLAYFDEVLSAFLVLRIPHSPPDADGKPPNDLVSFLTFLQVGFDASYISPRTEPPLSVPQENSSTKLLGPPPAGRSKPRPSSPLKPRPPPLIPPQTPNPTPQMEGSDRQYAVAEGIQLYTFIWGDAPLNTKDARKDDFSMIWDADAKEWVLIYRMDVTIVYLKTRVPDPLLCLTVSITLREKPLVVTPARKPLFDMLVHEDRSSTPTQQDVKALSHPGFKDLFGDLQEINLLDGLSSGTTFQDQEGDASMQIPSTRLGSFVRRQAYWLPPVASVPVAPAPSPTSARTSRPILRKAFRKTLNTCNGFQVRMRTIFVPYVLLPGGDDGDERREAGSEERSVVLCVEIENTGESSKDFEVGSVTVNVSGEGASSQLISWGESLLSMEPEAVFPLRLRPMEQYNLLYSVTFLHPIDANEHFMPRTSGQPAQTAYNELQRSVSIVINGRPSEVIDGRTSYLTDAFNSKWSCLLNLSPDQQPDLGDYQLNEPLTAGDALPTPASPFPVSSPRTQVEFERNHPINSTRSPAIGGSKRHTLSGLSGRRNTIPSPIKVRFSLPAGITATSSPSTSGPKTVGLPSIALNSPTVGSQSPIPGTPTTAGIYGAFPATPAYPAWPAEATAVPPTPYMQAPMMGQMGSTVGKIMEPRRIGPTGTLLPATPGSGGYSGDITERMMSLEPYAEPVVVSVALLSPSQTTGHSDARRNTGPKKDWIYPLDIFALEIFVFNQSPVTRRFEVSLPDRKRHRKQMLEDKRRSAIEGPPTNHRLVGEALSRMGSQAGIIPLENRIRIGPLRSETCQSVRMQFMALRPGLHAVDALTITDTEAEFSLNLRSVMDIVVRDPF